MKDPNLETVTFDVSLNKLTKEQEVELFKGMLHGTTTDLALKYGFDKKYKNMSQARASVYQIYRKILRAPALWGVDVNTVDAVRYAVETRKPGANNLKEVIDNREKNDYIKEALSGIRDKSAKIIELKLERGLTSKNERENISLKDLATVLSMAFDKGRLLDNKSTENVIHYAKLGKDISPEEALNLVLKAREALIENKK